MPVCPSRLAGRQREEWSGVMELGSAAVSLIEFSGTDVEPTLAVERISSSPRAAMRICKRIKFPS